MSKKKNIVHDASHNVSPMIFLEEPGKTKIVECIHLAPTPDTSQRFQPEPK